MGPARHVRVDSQRGDERAEHGGPGGPEPASSSGRLAAAIHSRLSLDTGRHPGESSVLGYFALSISSVGARQCTHWV